jgi:peptide/nickel transport system ATP-binding protein/oligopeptide transport system ATP-binding protein
LNPEFVVCDEPVSALDVSVRAQVLNLMRELQEKRNLTYLFISHDLSVVKHISDRVAVMYLGEIIELSDKEELFQNPLHPYTQALLSAIPIPSVDERRKRIHLQGDIPSVYDMPKGCKFHGRCPYADERCEHEKPEFREVGGGHFCACHNM